MALPKVYRLRRRQEFASVYQLGLRRSTPNLTLRALRLASISKPGLRNDSVENPIPPSCFGISISQKVSKRAVVRNRIKRQLHSALLHLLPRVSPGWKIVIVARSSAIQCCYKDFLQELEQLLMSAEVINGH
ncbi:MAG TPA: ribonuclease P protein component [Chroococcidiopsis sp.]